MLLQLRGTVAIFVLLCVTTTVSAMCPFCPPSSPPLSEQLAESDCAVRATWVRVIPAKTETDSPETVFRITDVDRDRSGKLKPSDLITVDFERQGSPGDAFFLMGKIDQEFTQWGQPLEIGDHAFAYIRALPSPEKPAEARLRHFLKFLEYKSPVEIDDRLISNDAFSEFARAKYADVVALKQDLPRDKLRKWLQGRDTDPVRLGFYAMLLGLCGDETDAAALWAQFEKPPGPNEVRISIDGMMGGYLLLTGEIGFQRLLTSKLRPENAADSDVYAVVNALRFLWEYAPDCVSHAHVAVAMQVVLQRPKFAELAVVDLARWKAWDATEEVIGWMGRTPFDEPASQAKLVQFARECLKDAKATETEDSAPAKLAQAFLDRLQNEQPGQWSAIERFLNPRPRKPSADLFDSSK